MSSKLNKSLPCHRQHDETLHLSIPWPPSVNAWVRAIPRGGHAVNVLTAKARAFKAQVNLQYGTRREPLVGYLAVVMRLYPPDRRRRDIDNFTKAVFDSLTEINVWYDDSQVKDLQILMMDVRKKGQVEIEIRKLGNV